MRPLHIQALYSGPTCACGDVETETNASSATLHLHSLSDCSVARCLRLCAVISVASQRRYLPPPSATTRFTRRGGERVKGAEATGTTGEDGMTSRVTSSDANGIQAGMASIDGREGSWSNRSDMTNLESNLKSLRSSDLGSKHYEGESVAGSPAQCGTVKSKHLRDFVVVEITRLLSSLAVL